MYSICLCLWPDLTAEDLRAGSKFEVEPWLSQGAAQTTKLIYFNHNSSKFLLL